MDFRKERKIKICFVSPHIYSLYNRKSRVPFGGAEVQLYLLSKELAKDDIFSVSVITGNYGLKKKTIKIYQKIKVYVSFSQKKKNVNVLFTHLDLFLILLSLIKINPDIVIQRIGSRFTGVCALYCKIFKKKFIFSIAHKNDVTNRGLKRLESFYYRYGLNNASYIVSQSKDQIFDLENWQKRKFNNILVIKTGYDITDVDIKTKKCILWVGTCVKRKKPEIFLKLAKNFSKEKFIMICPKGVDLNYWKEIRNNANKISNLEFVNFIPFSKIDVYFKNAKVFVNTSTLEGFPNTFIQALKNFTPVISLYVDPDNILTKNRCGFNCQGDFKKMEQYLKVLLKNKELYKSYAENSYFYAKKIHDIKKTSNDWVILLKKLIK